MGKLTNVEIHAIAKAGVPGKKNDGDGLYLQISKGGVASWLFRYKIDGKSREMGLGPLKDITLAKARAAAAKQREVLVAGGDPIAARDAGQDAKREAERKAKAGRITFQMLAEDYQKAHGASWSDKWRKGWIRKLELYAFPVLGSMSAADIRTEHVQRVLQPIWHDKTRTADEVRGQIESILDGAKALGLREGDNPARWRGHLDNLLSKVEKRKARQRQHFAAMPWREVPGLMQKLAEHGSPVAVAARLMIFTGARAQMVRFAAWDEFDLEVGVWLLPAERMKMRKAFAIPLAAEVMAMLQALQRVEGNPYLFPGQRLSAGRQAPVMFANAVRKLLHDIGHDDITRHGFRSSFRDWANEQTNYSREVCELSLAHDERDQTEAAYSRSDFLEKRRALMAEWAAYCTRTPAVNVVPLMRGAKA
ncbi:tyrosine-type recombinase/integrase [Pseudomonas sp. 18173]|uniref:tyrosine-type recombinase/integrase n=1 Tax=Pseudomonas sp. 18173 TaxID=3390055 RepID=UPI003D1ED362